MHLLSSLAAGSQCGGTSECFAACVARNGAWRDYRRSQDPRDRNQFCVARTHFHRICQELPRFFLVSWQDCVANLSRGSQRSQTHFPPGSVPTRPDTLCPLARGTGSSWAVASAFHVCWSSVVEFIWSVFPCRCHEEVRGSVCSSPSGGSFWQSIHNVRVSMCLVSMCWVRGWPQWTPLLSVQGDVPLVADCVGEVQLCLGVGCCPILVEAQHRCPHLQARWPFKPRKFPPSVSGVFALKVLEHLIHARIAPFINRQLSESQGGFRWGADALVGSLVNLLSMRASTHTFVAFVDIEKAFDTSWVEATLVRLHDIGVRGLVWNLLSNFLRHTVSQVWLGNELLDQWVDSGIAQGRVLSPLLFNLLVDGLAVEVQLASPGVDLPGNVRSRISCTLMIWCVADSPQDLQTALNAVHRWGCRFPLQIWCWPHQISSGGVRAQTSPRFWCPSPHGIINFPRLCSPQCLVGVRIFCTLTSSSGPL